MSNSDQKNPARFSLLYALEPNKSDSSKVKYFEDWLFTCKDRFCAYTRTPTQEQKLKLQKAKAEFMAEVRNHPPVKRSHALEKDFTRSFKKWSLTLPRSLRGQPGGKEGAYRAQLLHFFTEHVKAMVDTENESKRDKLSRAACERYRETQMEEEFVTWQKNHKFLYVQACAENLASKEALKKDFLKWCECPWGRCLKTFVTYLLTHKEGPSGIQTRQWGRAIMTLHYREHGAVPLTFAERDKIIEMASEYAEPEETDQKMLADLSDHKSDSEKSDSSDSDSDGSDSEGDVPDEAVESGDEDPVEDVTEMDPVEDVTELPKSPKVNPELLARKKKMMLQLELLEKEIALQSAGDDIEAAFPKFKKVADDLTGGQKRGFYGFGPKAVGDLVGSLPDIPEANQFKADVLKVHSEYCARKKDWMGFERESVDHMVDAFSSFFTSFGHTMDYAGWREKKKKTKSKKRKASKKSVKKHRSKKAKVNVVE